MKLHLAQTDFTAMGCGNPCAKDSFMRAFHGAIYLNKKYSRRGEGDMLSAN